MNSHEWYKQAKYGMMVHWGLYSILGGEWKGKRTPLIGEWIQSYFGIRNEEYSQLSSIFNPIYFSAEEWVTFAKNCGMQYIVVTSKHHEGFALYRSKADSYNMADATPFKRDVIAELAEACYKHGMKLGLYYSQELDWHDPDGGGYDKTTGCSGIGWSNIWDYPDNSKKDFKRCFENKIKPQVEEILTQYGDLCLIWFDTPGVITKAQSLELHDMIKKYQPDCLINSRIGNGTYDYVSLGDNEIPDKMPETSKKTDSGADMNGLEGFKYSPYGLYETAATLNDTWGYKYFDHSWKSPETVLKNKNHLNSMGINYLLNVGPDALGRIPSISQDILLKVAESL
ncbi:MAG: alpha-L-fucosidase [Oscillospiraceae bacterium]|nr:alpha-L-fucosidase [Oscillospiraceae bacterium]